MLFFWRKSPRNKKPVKKRIASTPIRGDFTVSSKYDGYDPYDTLPGLPRDEFGMSRKDDGKWSF